jgi:hypothetical protein
LMQEKKKLGQKFGVKESHLCFMDGQLSGDLCKAMRIYCANEAELTRMEDPRQVVSVRNELVWLMTYTNCFKPRLPLFNMNELA